MIAALAAFTPALFVTFARLDDPRPMTHQDGAIYLDAAASTPPRREAVDAAAALIDKFGDPRSGHALGRAARSALEHARGLVAEALGAHGDEVIFTSCGTESNALAVRCGAFGAAGAGRRRFVTSALEHPSVTESAMAVGFEVVEVPGDDTGRVDLDSWAAEVAVPGTVMASIQHASHLIGTIQPVAECIRLARPHGVIVHVDACQTAPAIRIDVAGLGADLLTVSSHKAYGLPGAAALFVRRGITPLPLLVGDARERRLRAGMPNLPGIAAMAAALEAGKIELPDRAAHLWSLSDRLRASLAESGVRVIGHATQRAPHIVSWTATDVDPETLLMTLEDRGILTSVIDARQLEDAGIITGGEVVVRFGLWPGVSQDDVDRVAEAVPPLVRDLQAIDYRAGAGS
jgi:cysteine desulfurase